MDPLDRPPAVFLSFFGGRPRVVGVSRRVLALHAAAMVAVDSTANAQLLLLPYIAQKYFGAGDWQSMLITAAPPTLMVASIFWNALLARITLRPFLAVYLVATLLPVALIALANNYEMVLALHVISSIGAAGWTPVKGELLRRFYPATARGSAFGWVNAGVLLVGIGVGLGLGKWLEHDGAAFRIYLPMMLAIQGGGLIGIAWLYGKVGDSQASSTLASQEGRPRATVRGLLAPLSNMRMHLMRDRTFRLYEAAFMTYGAGWMICEALRPILFHQRLGMSYGEIAFAYQAVLNGSLLLMAIPAGRILDRIGASRTSGLAFAALAVYPIALLAAHAPWHVWHVGIGTVMYGIAMAGVQQGWMMGPVSLAPRPELVADYVAIHTTLVGLRGLFAQFLGMLLYRATGSFAWPMVIASMCFAWGASQMWRLNRTEHNSARTEPLDDAREVRVRAGA